jgi:N-acetylmuramoyl-L-alanine amidase
VPAPFVGPPAPPAEPVQTAKAAPAAQPTPAPPAREPSPRRLASRQPHPLVVLDAGHGGRDPGAEGVGGVLEKDVVLDITRLVARRLATRLPVDVIMTRSDDSFIPIERRLALPGEGATLFISLHANACTDPSARGLEVFYGGGAVRTASTHGAGGPAALLGRYLHQALQTRIGGVRGGARPGSFGVLVRNPVPSALIEIGYLTHPGEAARAQDAGFHELVADAVVDAVGAFLRASAPPL